MTETGWLVVWVLAWVVVFLVFKVGSLQDRIEKLERDAEPPKTFNEAFGSPRRGPDGEYGEWTFRRPDGSWTFR